MNEQEISVFTDISVSQIGTGIDIKSNILVSIDPINIFKTGCSAQQEEIFSAKLIKEKDRRLWDVTIYSDS